MYIKTYFAVRKFNLLTEILKWEMKWLLGINKSSRNEYSLILCSFLSIFPIFMIIHIMQMS